jgi:hypothetical protein
MNCLMLPDKENTDLILRSVSKPHPEEPHFAALLRRKARRLEGWLRVRALHPSFETPRKERAAPQDEVFETQRKVCDAPQHEVRD